MGYRESGSLSPVVTQLETTELDPEQAPCCSAFSTASRHVVVPPPPLLPSFPPGPPGPPTVQYQVVLRSPENQCECKVMPSSATTFPCLHLNPWERLYPDICMGRRGMGPRASTINWQALSGNGMALSFPWPPCFLRLASSARVRAEKWNTRPLFVLCPFYRSKTKELRD